MTATHLSRTHAPCPDHRVWVSLLLIGASAPLCAADQPGEPPAEPPPITAVHKAQEVSFSYRSYGRYLSCSDLEHRVAVILVAIGARDDIEVKARNCDTLMISGDRSMDIDPTYGRNGNDPLGRDRTDPFGRDRSDPFNRNGSFGRANDDRQQSAQVRIRLMMPVEVTPQILQEIEKDRSRRELVSRVTRNPAASMNDPVVFAARREDVTLNQSTIKLRAEDCELLQQLTTQVIRKLDVKVKHQSFTCGPRTTSRIPPQITVETLVPTGAFLPMPNPEKKAAPGASGTTETEPTEPARP
ncbi:MAG: hypothetical protein SXG53_05170 [Pseudomonadota bacterium]|nr:hypothetical protein [Pseudomonadota bacterium]